MAYLVDAVFFDIDGTLMDHPSAAGRAIFEVMRDLAPGADPDTLAERWIALEDQPMAAYHAGELTLAEQRRLHVRALAAEFDLPLRTDGEVDARIAAYVEAYERSWCAYPDAVDVVRHLGEHTGLRLGVISNGDSDRQRRKLDAMGLAEFFPVVVVSGDIGVAKPAPGIFHAACDAYELPPSRAVYVGDKLDIDALGADRAGLHAIWLNREPSAGEGTHLPQIGSLESLAGRLPRD